MMEVYMNDNETNQVPQARQLRIRGMDGKPVEKKEPKEKEKPGNKWLIVIILGLTIVASLIFKLTSGVSEQPAAVQDSTVPGVETPEKPGSLFGPAEFNFTK